MGFSPRTVRVGGFLWCAERTAPAHGACRVPNGTLTGMSAAIRAVVMEHRIPAGALGPEPVTLDVRAYLVTHATGVILVDTGMDASGHALDAALGEAGAAWPDVSHVLITHAHRDHVGALDHVRQAAPAAAVMASPMEGLPGLHPLADRDVIGPLRVFASPGHTPGHLSLVDEEQGVLLVGDCVGVVAGRLVRAPERFTADLEVAEVAPL